MALPAISIDTLEIAKALEEAGVPQSQAEAQTRIYVRLMNMVIEDKLPTKQDLITSTQTLENKIIAVEIRLSEKITSVENKLNEKITDVENRLTEKIISVENKLNQKIVDIENRLTQVEKSLSKLDNKIEILNENINNFATKLTLKLGTIVVTGIIVLGALIKL